MIEPKDNLSSDQSFAPPPPPWRQNAYNRPVAPIPPMPPMGGNFSGGSLPGSLDLFFRSWNIFTGNARTFLGISILPIIVQIIAGVVLFFVALGGAMLSFANPMLMASNIKRASGLVLILIVITVVGLIVMNILSQIALIYAAISRDRRVGVGEAYSFATGKLFPYLWVVILLAIIIGGGMNFFIVPGILFAIWFAFANFVVVGEDSRGMSALLRSREYVRGKGWAVLWRFIAFIIILIIAGLIIFVGIYLVGGVITSLIKSPIIQLLIGLILMLGSFIGVFVAQLIVTALFIIYSGQIYEHLRACYTSSEKISTGSQKTAFMAIGILGWIIPFFIFFAFSGFLLTLPINISPGDDLDSIDSLENTLNNYQNNSNVNIYSNNQNSNSSLFQDTDKDGLSDSIEKSLGTNSNIADTDFDGLSDGEEVNTWKTKPTNPDTDGDGFRDGDEAKNGYNPLGNGKTENN